MKRWLATRCSRKFLLSKPNPKALACKGQGLFCFSAPALVLPFVSVLIFVISVDWVTAEELPSRPYLQELREQARSLRLADEREWHLLLHYRPRLFGGYESEQDDPGFFMSPNGKTDPEAELAATLAQFFSKDLVGRSQQPAQCAFIARYHWLKERLAFDDMQLRPILCERFDR